MSIYLQLLQMPISVGYYLILRDLGEYNLIDLLPSQAKLAVGVVLSDRLRSGSGGQFARNEGVFAAGNESDSC